MCERLCIEPGGIYESMSGRRYEVVSLDPETQIVCSREITNGKKHKQSVRNFTSYMLREVTE